MAIIENEGLRAWEAGLRASVRDDPMFRFDAYRVALYLSALAVEDCRRLQGQSSLADHTDQLKRAVASIGANVAEGLGRRSVAERSQFFSIALGSLREAITWYLAVEAELGAEVVDVRCEHLSELRRLLIGAIKWLATKPPKSTLF